VVGDDAAQRNLAVRAGKARRSSLGTFVRVGRAEVAVSPSVSLGTRVALSGGRRAGDAIGRFADGTGGAHACEDKDKDKRREKRKEKREKRKEKREKRKERRKHRESTSHQHRITTITIATINAPSPSTPLYMSSGQLVQLPAIFWYPGWHVVHIATEVAPVASFVPVPIVHGEHWSVSDVVDLYVFFRHTVHVPEFM